MAHVELTGVSLDFPIYNAKSMSLRHNLLRLGTGGKISSEAGKKVHIKALDDINLSINEGDSLGLLGHNGSGKSTLLRTIAGIYKPTQGTINSEGKISTVFELGSGVDHELTGRENILRMSMLQGASYKEAFVILDEIIEFSGLGDFIDLPVRTYSSGMTMRLMFGVATSVKPEIFLVDEMISTGDENFQKKANLKMQEISNTSKVFVLASHDVEMIKSMCNKIIRLEHGRIVEVIK
jgi:ABC-type polysaccharide/polyol phosphate transport system ATPase subunit